MPLKKNKKTTVGGVHADALAFTAGRDMELDRALVEVDCIGTAAHVSMLSGLPIKPPLFKRAERDRVVGFLIDLLRENRMGKFKIRLADQDVHMAVERRVTASLGDLGKRIHTGRSRNDQVALDMRLFGKQALLDLMGEIALLSRVLLAVARKHRTVPMVGRTHMQKAMPSSVGLWASAYVEGLLDDLVLVMTAYEITDQNPLGSAAGYGVPLPIDRELVTRLLGFGKTVHNVLHAGNTRGKQEAAVLQSLGQVMVTLSRFSQDLILYTLPELGYFNLPAAYTTGSSIMPQKTNPDVLELIRARAAGVIADGGTVLQILRGSPSGYNRDVQEVKEPYLRGLDTTRMSVTVLVPMIKGLTVNRKRLIDAFTPEVFAADEVLDRVGQGVPFRDAYNDVKANLDALANVDPHVAIARKCHEGTTAGLDLDGLEDRVKVATDFVRDERRMFYRSLSRLLGIRYPSDLEPGKSTGRR